ncbi:MAG: cell envelope integrity protein TolA, partial [Burkholderiales bacterium]
KLEREKKLDLERKDRERKDKERRDLDRAERERMDKELARELDRDRDKSVKDQLAREAEAVRREQEMRNLLAKQAASAGDNRARATWIDKIRSKIRGNVLVPDGINGNPEAVFDVVQLPSGEVVNVRLRKSSGVKAYDESVERAILKSSPLPRPDSPELFERELRLTFRPLE